MPLFSPFMVWFARVKHSSHKKKSFAWNLNNYKRFSIDENSIQLYCWIINSLSLHVRLLSDKQIVTVVMSKFYLISFMYLSVLKLMYKSV